MRNIIWPNEKNINPKIVGGKAWHLIQLYKAGFNVPKFFVITTDAFHCTSFYLEEEIREDCEKIHTQNFAVRSSATCEDQTNSSFAGQFESFLSVPYSQLFTTIKTCWNKTKSKRVIAYTKNHTISLNSVRMAVIVQEMISAEKGGVIFTKNVFGNKKNQLLIESAEGLGEQVVSGLVNPERIIMNRTSGEVLEKESPKEKILTDKEIKELTQLALKIERFYKSPQDIEWAIRNRKIYILQSRPMTGGE